MELGLILGILYVTVVLAVTIFLIVLAWRFVVAHEQMTVAHQQMARHFLQMARDLKELTVERKPPTNE